MRITEILPVGKAVQQMSLEKIVVAVTGIAIVVFCAGLAYRAGGSVSTKMVRETVERERQGIVADYEKKLAEKNAVIKAREQELENSRKAYGLLVKKLNERAKLRAAIKPPQTEAELRKRFEDLGYKPK